MAAGSSGNGSSPSLAQVEVAEQDGTAASSAADRPVGDGRFPHLGNLDRTVAEKFVQLRRLLDSAGAEAAAKRLDEIDEEIKNKNLNFDDLERYIDPDRAVDELNSARGRLRWRKLFKGEWRAALRPLLSFPKSVRYAHLLRNIAALAPLIFTWIMLGLAAQGYANDLSSNPQAVNKPFLLLWQQGFGIGFRSFEQVTVIDFSLLLFVGLLTVWVHWAEGQADLSANQVYESVDSLKVVLARHAVPVPLTAQDWTKNASGLLADTRELLSDTLKQTKETSKASERVITEASTKLAGIQDAGQQFIEEFKVAVLETLASVTEQNAHFIEVTGETNQQVLQALVEQEMQPLLAQMQEMLDQFKEQQAVYAAAVAGLTKGVDAIAVSAAGLGTNAQAFAGSTESIAKSLTTLASSQEGFAAKVDDAAQSMSTAATAMTEVKDTFRSNLVAPFQEMTSNITSASDSLRMTQDGLARTTGTMGAAGAEFAAAMNAAAIAFATAMNSSAEAFAKTTDRWVSTVGDAVPVPPRHRWFPFFRRRPNEPGA